MLEVSISQVVFVTLESTLFFTQLLFLFTKLKSKFIKTFLAVNGAFVLFNVASIIRSNSIFANESVTYSIQAISLMLVVLSAWIYIHRLSKENTRKFTYFIAGAIALVTISASYLVSTTGMITDKTLLSGVLSLLILFGAYVSMAIQGSKRAFFSFAILFLVSYLLTFVFYSANSVELLFIILNVLFLLLGVFHNLKVFKIINSVFSSDSASDKNLKRELSKYNLTPRQEEIAILVIKGYRSKEIADMCDISPGAERKHVSNINAAIGVSSRIELTRKFSYFL